MFSRLIIALGFVVLAAAGFHAGGLAIFTDSAPSTANSFTTGTLDLRLTDKDEADVDSASASLSFASMAPGATVTELLTPRNLGSLDLRYAISGSATNADAKGLKDQLVLTIRRKDATTPNIPCDNFDGTLLYTGDLDSTAGKLIGDNAQGSQAGDRTIAPGGEDRLCFRVNLPLAATNTFQNASTTATFTFDAEQTANN